MKHPFLRHILSLTLCACLAVTLLTFVSSARSVHAATTSAASCSNLDMGRGKTWNPGDATWWHTCKGTSLELIYQHDGNFVLYIGGKAKWASNTSVTGSFSSASYAQFQNDGNLVVYTDQPIFGDYAAWASNTNGKGATALALQKDGNLVIYTANGKALWASNTCCYS